MNKFIAQAVFTVTGKTGKGLDGEAYAYINEEWVDATTLDSYNLIAAEISRLQAEYDSKQYQRGRAEAYPSLTEQADMQFHDAVDGTTTWQDAIQAVKDAYPKP